MKIEDLFPPKGHLYLTEERIEGLRRAALVQSALTIDARTVMELICDWRNMRTDWGGMREVPR